MPWDQKVKTIALGAYTADNYGLVRLPDKYRRNQKLFRGFAFLA